MRLVLPLLLLASICQAQDTFPPIPPPMAKRAITKPENPPPGRQIDLYGDGKYILFVPPNWKTPEKLSLTIHFHGAAWFAIDEHLRRGLKEPLVAIYVGEGSSVYRNAFIDPDSW